MRSAEDLAGALHVRGGRGRLADHGTRTSEGERFVERALSASVTCRLQGRSLFAYLIGAHARSDPLPALT